MELYNIRIILREGANYDAALLEKYSATAIKARDLPTNVKTFAFHFSIRHNMTIIDFPLVGDDDKSEILDAFKKARKIEITNLNDKLYDPNYKTNALDKFFESFAKERIFKNECN